jgi:ribonuclease MRP protein subunit RMP1
MASQITQQLQNETTSTELANLSKILHLLHHRSKNQHRRSIWYRHFNTMRRHLRFLEAEVFPELPAAWPPSRKRKRKQECEIRAEQRLHIWADVLVSKWFAAFSQVVANKRFATLGLVLCAALGRLCKITGVLEMIEEDAGGDVKRLLIDFADGEGESALRTFDKQVNEMDDAGRESDDIGVVIERDDTAESVEPLGFTAKDALKRAHDQSLHALGEEPIPSKKKKKSKGAKGKQGDAIDDIFAELF